MELKDMIARRRSVRAYEDRRVDKETLDELLDFIGGVKRLDASIRAEVRLVERSQVTTMQSWATPHFLQVSSEEKGDWLENAGFMMQQVDLYLQSKGLGSCWVGLGLPETGIVPEGMKHVILMPFGYPKNVPERSDVSEFRRKELHEISDVEDARLEAVRIAPSACNGQPWYFVHEGEKLHLFRDHLGLVKRPALTKMNRIDAGIALAHLYVTNPDGFCFFKAEKKPEHRGLIYVGTVKLA